MGIGPSSVSFYYININSIIMAKGEGLEDDQQKDGQEQHNQAPIKKKIIKKVPFKSETSAHTNNELKDWKPVKIQKKQAPIPKKQSITTNIAATFLSSLPKPINKETKRSLLDFDDEQTIRLRFKPVVNLQKPTPQQIKWDIEDQTFIQKQFIPGKKIEQHLQEQGQQQQDEQFQEEVVIASGLIKKSQIGVQTKVRNIDLNKILDDNWREAAHNNAFKSQLWQASEGLLDGRDTLGKIAREAQSKAKQIDDEINKRSYERKQMKNRYGW